MSVARAVPPHVATQAQAAAEQGVSLGKLTGRAARVAAGLPERGGGRYRDVGEHPEG